MLAKYLSYIISNLNENEFNFRKSVVNMIKILHSTLVLWDQSKSYSIHSL